MSEENSALDAEDILNLLGNSYRRQIIRLLSSRKLYPQQIADILGITPSAVIKNLKILEEAGLVEKEEEKREAGGRPYQFFSIQRNIHFSFEMFNPSLFRIVTIQPIESSEKKLKDISLADAVKENLQEIIDIQKKLVFYDQKKMELLRKREHKYELLRDYSKGTYPDNMINVFRGMIELKKDDWFSIQEIEKTQGIKSEEIEEIIKAWHELGLIELDKTDLYPKIRFKLNFDNEYS